MTVITHDHDAILRVHPEVAIIDGDEGAFDHLGNEIQIDVAAVEAVEATVIQERKFMRLRALRNKALIETDWAALSDVTMSDEMRTYRQALRDLPANTADPDNPVWPTKPE